MVNPFTVPNWKVFIKKDSNGNIGAEPGVIRPVWNHWVGFYSRDVDVVICFDSYTCFGLHRYKIPRNRGIILKVADWAPNIEVYYEMVEADFNNGPSNPNCSNCGVDWREYAFDLMKNVIEVPYDESTPWSPEGARIEQDDRSFKTKRAELGKPRNPVI